MDTTVVPSASPRKSQDVSGSSREEKTPPPRAAHADAGGRAAYVPPPAVPFLIGGFCGAFVWLALIFCHAHEDGSVTMLFAGSVYTGISAGCCLLAMSEDRHPILPSLWRSALLALGMIVPFVILHLCGVPF